MVDVQNLAIGAAAGAGAALLVGGKGPLGSILCPNCGNGCCAGCKCCPNCACYLSPCSKCGQCCSDRTTNCPNCGVGCMNCPRCSQCCCTEDNVCKNCRCPLNSIGYGLVGDG